MFEMSNYSLGRGADCSSRACSYSLSKSWRKTLTVGGRLSLRLEGKKRVSKCCYKNMSDSRGKVNSRRGKQVVLDSERLQLQRDVAHAPIASELMLLSDTLKITQHSAADLVIRQRLLDRIQVGRADRTA